MGRLIDFQDEQLIMRLERYLQNHPQAAIEDLKPKYNPIVRLAENNIAVIREYFGIKEPAAPEPIKTFKRTPRKCKPSPKKQPALVKTDTLTTNAETPIYTDQQLPVKNVQEDYQPLEISDNFTAPRNPNSSETLAPYMPIPEESEQRTRQKRIRFMQGSRTSAKPDLEEITQAKDSESFQTTSYAVPIRHVKPRNYNHVPEDIMKAVINIVAECFSADKENVCPATRLEDLGVNDLNLAELYMEIEERLELTIDEREDHENDPFTNNLRVVGGLAEYIMEAKKNPKPLLEEQETPESSFVGQTTAEPEEKRA